MKTEALKLADELKTMGNAYTECIEASDMIRKLVAELDKQEKVNKVLEEGYGCDPAYFIDKSPQTKPLSDEEIIEIGNSVVNLIDSNEGWVEFARAIEERHGIK